MTRYLSMGRLPDAEYDELLRRQRQVIANQPLPRPAQASRRARNAQPLTAQEIEDLRQALIQAFKR